jgi:hypothetical protein
MGSGGIAPSFLTSALDRGEWSASRLCHLTPRGKSSQYPMDRRLAGLQSRSVRFGEKKNLALLGSEPGPSSP